MLNILMLRYCTILAIRRDEMIYSGRAMNSYLEQRGWCAALEMLPLNLRYLPCSSRRCWQAEALRVDIHVRIGGVGIYMRSSRRNLAAVVIEGAGTALRWRVTKKALQASK
jgi:hypothetical protein